MPITRAARVFALAVLLAAAACAGSPKDVALKRHAYAAAVLDEVSGAARDVVLDLRAGELKRAADKATADGTDVRAAVVAAAAAFDARGLVDATNVLIAAKDVYVRAVLLHAREDAPSWADVKPALHAALEAYSALRKALGDAGDRLPEVPTAIAELLE